MTTTLTLAQRNGWFSLLAEASDKVGPQPDGSLIFRIVGCPEDVDAQAVLARFFGYWSGEGRYELTYAELWRRIIPSWLRKAG